MAMYAQPARPVPLWRTKLYQPRVGSGLLRRPRLESLLDQAVDCKFVLVSAPAGFGKTTLVAQWLEVRGHSAASLSCSESDGDLATFLRYLIAAIRIPYVDACPKTWAQIESVVTSCTLGATDQLHIDGKLYEQREHHANSPNSSTACPG